MRCHNKMRISLIVACAMCLQVSLGTPVVVDDVKPVEDLSSTTEGVPGNSTDAAPKPSLRHVFICVKCSCFSGDSTVVLEGGRQTVISELRVGDRVRTIDVATGRPYYDDVITFLDRRENGTNSVFIRLTLENGDSISLSPYHLIYFMTAEDAKFETETLYFTVGKPRFANRVKPGDYLYQENGDSQTPANGAVKRKVVQMSYEQRDDGYFAPLTSSGNILVDGTLASCYAHFESHTVAHLAMAPLRAALAVSKYFNFDGSRSSFSTHYPDDGIHQYANLLIRLAAFVIPKPLE